VNEEVREGMQLMSEKEVPNEVSRPEGCIVNDLMQLMSE
jgi:hypothetical protein